MTLEQIVNTHPCPIIRGKIMENVATITLPKKIGKEVIDIIDYFGWDKSKEGYDFWNAVFESLYYNKTAPYSDLKHFDNSYVPEPAKQLVMWRKIDANDLCIDTVVAMHIDEPMQMFTGTLELNRYDDITIYIGNGQYWSNLTHYIALSDLSSLPIE
jgi:hypothetical protein